MPIYEYKCRKGHLFEAIQSMSEDPLTDCEQCGSPVERVFHPVAVHFKGSGFYTTDYGSQSKGSQDGSGDSAEKKSEEKAGKSGDAKSESGKSKSGGTESSTAKASTKSD